MKFKHITLYKYLTIGILGLFGGCYIFLLTSNHNAGLTPDSAVYISVARNLSEGTGFVSYSGHDLVLQPPFYPILLASAKELFSFDPMISTGYLNTFFFGLIIILTGLFLLKHLKSYSLVILGTLSVLISFALVQASFMALSELLFIFLVLLFLYQVDIYRLKSSFTSLIIFSFAASLACLTRYTGVVLILTGIIAILIFGKNNIKEKYWHLFNFIFISSLPISVWIIRNYVISGTLVGLRASSTNTLLENIGYFFNIIIPWYLPENNTIFYFSYIFIIIAAWVYFGLYSAKSSIRAAIKLVTPIIIFILFYACLIVVSSTTTAYDQISDRLLSPIYIPMVLILFLISDKILSWLNKSFHPKYFTVLFVIGIGLLLTFPVRNTVGIIKMYTELSGWGYSSNMWRGSETIEYLREHELLTGNFLLYSNEPGAVYLLANLKTKHSPAKTFYNSQEFYYGNSKQRNFWRINDKVCLVWFNRTNRRFLFSINELKKKFKMSEVAALKDGTIYTFSKE